jgi:hypothetical protein
MSALQGWVFLLLLAGLAARSFERPRLTPNDLGTLGAAAGLAIAQRALVDQVALDEPLIGPLLMALPLVAALRGELRDGLAAAFGTWLALTVVAGAVPVPVAGDLSQDAFVLATVFAALIAGAAAALPASHKHLGPLLGFGWLAFFQVRDGSLLGCASVWGVVTLAVAWSLIGVRLLPRRSASA